MLGLGASILFFILVVLCSYNNRASATGGVSEFLKNTFEGENNGVHEKTAGLYRYFGSNLHPNKVNLVKDCNYNDPDKIQFCPPALNPKNFDFPMVANKIADDDEQQNKVIPTKCFEAEGEGNDSSKNDPDCSHFRYVTNENGKESRLLPTTAPVGVTETVFHQSRLSRTTTDDEKITV